MAVKIASGSPTPVGAAKGSPQKTTGSTLRPKTKSTSKPKVKPKPKPKAKAKPAAVSPMDDPNALTAPLTPRTLEDQVTAQTNLYAGPATSEIAGERAVNQQMMTNIPAWYQEYQQALASARQNTAAAYASALGQQQQTADSSSALDTTQRGALNSQLAADAATRGQTVDPSIAATGQQAAASRRGALDSQRNLTAGIGATEVAYRAGREVVGAGQKVKALEAEAQRGRNIDKSASELAIKKGDFATTTRQKLIDSEHQKQLENKAFDLNVAKADASAKNDATKTALDAQALAATRALNQAKLTNDQARIRIAQQNLEIAQQRADAYVKGQSNKTAGKTPATVVANKKTTASARSDVNYAKSQIQALRTHRVPVKVPEIKNGKPTGKYVPKLDNNGNPVLQDAKLTPSQIRNALLNGDGPLRPINGDAINAALALLDRGFLSSAEIAALRRAYPGLSIAGAGLPTARTRRGRGAGLGTSSPVNGSGSGGAGVTGSASVGK